MTQQDDAWSVNSWTNYGRWAPHRNWDEELSLPLIDVICPCPGEELVTLVREDLLGVKMPTNRTKQSLLGRSNKTKRLFFCLGGFSSVEWFSVRYCAGFFTVFLRAISSRFFPHFSTGLPDFLPFFLFLSQEHFLNLRTFLIFFELF